MSLKSGGYNFRQLVLHLLKIVFINPANVINLLFTTAYFSRYTLTPVNYKEIILSEILEEIILRSMEDESFTAERAGTLDFEESRSIEAEFVDTSPDDITNAELAQETEVCLPEEQGQDEEGEVDFDYKKRAVEYWKSATSKRKSFQTVQHRFRKVKYPQQLYRWEKYVEADGARRDKLLYVSNYVLAKFTDAIDEGGIIHDRDLQRWAHEAKENVEFPSFKASHSWISNFKGVHDIVSRKITKFISRPRPQNTEDLNLAIDNFIRTVKPQIRNYGAENVFNSDESGFNLELHSGRTLAVRG
ncbi:uncharacterized protein LOC143187334 [Calliopsis andreniformis]|uniref:uncharacterized protein LOC143187334 n=1 Tax=Calliopsis andreniformis TaxID=337506 RepID=UPI003FCEC17B